jgi:proline iminopeptidase
MDKVRRSARDEYVEFDGARIWTATQGQGEGLVLLHGGPGGSDQLQPVAEMVDDLVRVHRYEQPGCGRSTGGPPYTVERWLDDLELLRKHWEHPQWIVFGHSFGAELALAYAAALPSRTRAIIYMSCLPAVLPGKRGEEEFRANRAARIAEPLRARFVELRRLRDEGGENWTPTLATELARIGLAAEFGDPASAALHVDVMIKSTRPVNEEINKTLGEDFRRYAIKDEFLASMQRIGCPALVLHGDRDLRPMWAAEGLAERLPNARLVTLPSGHFPWLEAPFELRRSLRSFVSEIVSAT